MFGTRSYLQGKEYRSYLVVPAREGISFLLGCIPALEGISFVLGGPKGVISCCRSSSNVAVSAGRFRLTTNVYIRRSVVFDVAKRRWVFVDFVKHLLTFDSGC